MQIIQYKNLKHFEPMMCFNRLKKSHLVLQDTKQSAVVRITVKLTSKTAENLQII